MTIPATGETRSVRTVRKNQSIRKVRMNQSIRRAAGVGVQAVAGAGVPGLRIRSSCCRKFSCTSAAVGAFRAKAPRNQPEASSACPLCQGPLPASGGPVPGPGGGLGNDGGDKGHPPGRPRGPGPVQVHQGHPPQLGHAVITSHPGIVAQAARACQAPGLPSPGRHRPAGPGRRRCPGPAASALAPRRSSAQAGSPGRAAGPPACRAQPSQVFYVSHVSLCSRRIACTNPCTNVACTNPCTHLVPELRFSTVPSTLSSSATRLRWKTTTRSNRVPAHCGGAIWSRLLCRHRPSRSQLLHE